MAKVMGMASTDRVFKLNEWQDRFLYTDCKYSALFNEFGSGKTTAGILKFWDLMVNYPGNFGVIIRNIHDELQSATIPQFFELIFASFFELDLFSSIFLPPLVACI